VILLRLLAALAGVLSLMRTVPPQTRGADDGEPVGCAIAIAAAFGRLLQILTTRPSRASVRPTVFWSRPGHLQAQQQVVGARCALARRSGAYRSTTWLRPSPMMEEVGGEGVEVAHGWRLGRHEARGPSSLALGPRT